MTTSNFEWDDKKDAQNRVKHGISFYEAQQAFLDPNRLIAPGQPHVCSKNNFNIVFANVVKQSRAIFNLNHSCVCPAHCTRFRAQC